VDWDNDGRKDLVTGERDGHIRIYVNTGTDAKPAFSGYTYLRLGGSAFDCGYSSKPDIIDWNNDGKKDVLCGEDAGMVYLLINTGTDAKPQFGSSVLIRDGGRNLDAGGRASPVVADWNGDGKKDLIVGATSGQLYYYENIGTDAGPEFNGSRTLVAHLSGRLSEWTEPIDVGYYSRPDVADWDNDGLLDILCGNRYYDGSPTGGVWYFHATATYVVTPTSGANGRISPNIPEQVQHGGESSVYTFAPDADYHISDVVVDANSVGPVGSYQFTNVTGNHTIHVVFAKNLVPDMDGNGAVDYGDFAVLAENWMRVCSAPDWCQGCDFDTSGTVDFADLCDFVDHWLWCRADLDSDGAVDFTDYTILSESWMNACSAPDWCGGCDFDTSGRVDVGDLLNLAEHWLR
jgi:hypothetical protein